LMDRAFMHETYQDPANTGQAASIFSLTAPSMPT
jgi:hypothetical protein